jgi:hypothetical protein
MSSAFSSFKNFYLMVQPHSRSDLTASSMRRQCQQLVRSNFLIPESVCDTLLESQRIVNESASYLAHV